MPHVVSVVLERDREIDEFGPTAVIFALSLSDMLVPGLIKNTGGFLIVGAVDMTKGANSGPLSLP